MGKRLAQFLVRLLMALASINLFISTNQSQSEISWLSCMARYMVALFLLILALPDPPPSLDSKFARRAHKGDAVILSFQQYMALHYTAPERYPLQRDEVFELLRSEDSNLHMNWQDYNQLLEVIEALEQDERGEQK